MAIAATKALFTAAKVVIFFVFRMKYGKNSLLIKFNEALRPSSFLSPNARAAQKFWEQGELGIGNGGLIFLEDLEILEHLEVFDFSSFSSFSGFPGSSASSKALLAVQKVAGRARPALRRRSGSGAAALVA